MRDLHPFAENLETVAMHLHALAQRPMQIKQYTQKACLQTSVLLQRRCQLAGGAYIACRLSSGSVKRLSHTAGKNKRLKWDL